MKKIIRIFFIISLVCFSFFYTDKVMNLLNSKDPLMVKLNNIKNVKWVEFDFKLEQCGVPKEKIKALRKEEK